MRPVMTMKTIHDSLGRRLEGLDDDREGKFHGWGSGYEEFESGPGNYTVAIVEFPDGKIDTVMPYLIRFLDSDEANSQALDCALANPIIIG
ncbi:hypothetical protein N015_13135 [Pseudomonas asturiensis]|uniref:Uncharacterized protein n=1 Tax=Pseudomonas asturiensis TaxID=1190415 RepID=A0ABX6HD36_9PSED|nr:hypothetical protein [Pseudomonas asturiensis]QHF03298.1 hypothetical protein N015_13135 [Pseudomonas asturiensis]